MTPNLFSRRTFLQATGSSLVGLTLAARALGAKDAARERPNILFCLSDDQSWPHASAYGDVDASPTKTYMLKHQTDAKGKKLFELSFGKRPAEELYDCRKDPFQTRNLADDPAYKSAKQKLSARLTAYLKKTGDSRETAGAIMWDEWRYYGHNKWKVLAEK